MIIDFSIKNFGSIKEEQLFSFEADKSKHLEEHYVTEVRGLRLLKLALIYGANASGKTTVLKALDFLRDLVLAPIDQKNKTLDFEPFLFCESPYESTSELKISFIQNDVKYSYELVFSHYAIISENLYFSNPNRAKVFSRITDLDSQFTSISFGSKLKVDNTHKKGLESNTLWNNTVLGGFLKTNIEVYELREVLDWFTEYLRPMVFSNTELTQFITNRVKSNEVNTEELVDLLSQAGSNITGIDIKEEEQEVPDKILEFLENQLNALGAKSRIKEMRDKGKMPVINLNFEYNIAGNPYRLEFEQESQGTKRYYGFAGLLLILVKNASVFPIDELEASLHPDLFIHFLLSFIMNASNSQVIATTHNREILGNKDLFRDDAIWITEKDESGATSLYSFADFDSSVIRDSTNRLNVYKSGKLGGVPHIGDYFIETSHE